MAAISNAVDSTMCGQPPRCIHIETRATACCFSAAAAVVAVTVVAAVVVFDW
jgi:hypothetical protein